MNATLQGNRISVAFRFDLRLIEIVKTIPNYAWNHKQLPGVWSFPATPWHCAKVMETLSRVGFWIDPKIEACADAKAEKPNLRKQLPKNLFPYQKDGIEHIYAARGRALIADDMGLGKSAEALVWWNLFGGEKVLIVSPANVTWKWALKEVKLWASDRTWQVIETGKQKIEDKDITIMSYAIATARYEELMTTPFDTIIFDEAHYLKGNKSQRNRAAKKFAKGAPYLLLLTGTPFKNKRIEMYQLLNILDGYTWSNIKEFGERYCGGKLEHGAWIIPPDKETNTEELQARLSPIMLRRTKKQVAHDLPDLTRVSIPMYADNAGEYEDILEGAREQARVEGYQPGRSLALLNTLRQVVGRGKVQAAIELAEDVLETGNQVVLFAHHKQVVRGLIEGLVAHRLPVGLIGVIDGSTPNRDRQLLSQDFLDGNKRVMIVSSAGKEGIDLYSGSHIIFVERLWTPADEEQIETRLHRQGQKNPVTAHYFVAVGTVDEVMDDVVESKRKEFGNLIDTDDVVRTVWYKMFKD